MPSGEEDRNHSPALAPLLKEIGGLAHELGRVGRALNALESLATSGNPAHTDLGGLSSEDLGALLGTLGELTTAKAAALEKALHQVGQTTKRA